MGITAVQAGYADYNSAVRSTIRKAAAEGLRVKYPNSGLTRRLDTAVRQNVLDGVRSINQDVLTQVGKEFGADGVEISAHALCAEDHLPYQGRQFSLKEFEQLQGSLKRAIGTWNCKHTFHPILLGISQPAYSDEQLLQFSLNSREEIEIDGKRLSRYEWSQEQRRIETEIRYQKDVAVAAKASGDMQLRREAQARINALSDQYTHISADAGLIEKRERMAVSGFHRVKSSAQLQNPSSGGIIQSVPSKTAARFDRQSGALSADYRKVLEDRFDKGSDLAKKVYDKYVPDGGAVVVSDLDTSKHSPHHDPKTHTISMNFAEDSNAAFGIPGSVWYHEHGHYIDQDAGKVSSNQRFLQVLKKDVQTYERDMQKSLGLKDVSDARFYVAQEMRKNGDDITDGIQDIFGGVCSNPGYYPGAKWGHSSKYWRDRAPYGACKEAFANMFEACFDPDKRKLMEHYFPTAFAEFEKMLGGIL